MEYGRPFSFFSPSKEKEKWAYIEGVELSPSE